MQSKNKAPIANVKWKQGLTLCIYGLVPVSQCVKFEILLLYVQQFLHGNRMC